VLAEWLAERPAFKRAGDDRNAAIAASKQWLA
jgi:hypothetical protein